MQFGSSRKHLLVIAYVGGTGCECFDFDAGVDTDLADWAEFQTAFTGP